jgi:hypothetical protein
MIEAVIVLFFRGEGSALLRLRFETRSNCFSCATNPTARLLETYILLKSMKMIKMGVFCIDVPFSGSWARFLLRGTLWIAQMDRASDVLPS